MSDPARAVFSIFGKGTAVAISEDLLVTCEHVVKDAKEVTLFSRHPVFEGETDLKKRKAKGKVLADDPRSGAVQSGFWWNRFGPIFVAAIRKKRAEMLGCGVQAHHES